MKHVAVLLLVFLMSAARSALGQIPANGPIPANDLRADGAPPPARPAPASAKPAPGAVTRASATSAGPLSDAKKLRSPLRLAQSAWPAPPPPADDAPPVFLPPPPAPPVDGAQDGDAPARIPLQPVPGSAPPGGQLPPGAFPGGKPAPGRTMPSAATPGVPMVPGTFPQGALPGGPMQMAPAPGQSLPPNAFSPGYPSGSFPPEGFPPGALPQGMPAQGMPATALPPEFRRLRTTADPAAPSEETALEQDVAPIPASLVFRTRDVVRPDLMRGRNYRLLEYAPLIDYKFRFEIETPWGTIPAHGMAMLEVRLRELQSIEYASRIANKNPMFVEGLYQVAAKTPVGAYVLVTDPVGSVKRGAAGVVRLVRPGYGPDGRRVDCESRRRIALLVCCDPETRNPVLQCLLDEMATNAGAGWITGQVAINIGLPGLGALPAAAGLKEMMATRSSREIGTDLDASLAALGVPAESRAKFLSSASFSTAQRMAFVFYLRRLIGIENLSSLVDGANDAANESEALAAIQELRLLVELRQTRAIERVSFVGLPLIALEDGKQMIVTTSDYIVDSPRINQMILRYRNDFPFAPTTFVSTGRVSGGAQKLFAAVGIDVVHHRLGSEDPTAKAKKPVQTAAGPRQTGPAPGPRTQ